MGHPQKQTLEGCRAKGRGATFKPYGETPSELQILRLRRLRDATGVQQTDLGTLLTRESS